MREVEAIAETTGKAIDASRELGGFLKRYVSGPLDQISGMVEDGLKVMRWKRQIRLMDKADEFMEARGLRSATRPVPLRLAVPILQEGSLEEDDDLQDRWARLLVNAADANSGTEPRHAFVSILKDLTSLDAINLEKIYSIPLGKSAGVCTTGLPGEVYLEGRQGETLREDVATSLSNLSRLGLVSPPSVVDGGEALFEVHHTKLGSEFVKACSAANHDSRAVS